MRLACQALNGHKIEMDKIIAKRILSKKTIWIVTGILIFVVFVAYGYRLSLTKVYKADADEIVVNKVLYGDFDVVLLNASVVPLRSVILSSPEGGTVAEIFTENGASVVKGTRLLRIANPNALSGYTSSETSITEQINGSYKFMDAELLTLTERERSNFRKRNMGVVFQNFNLIDELTVFENIELPLIYNKLPSGERERLVNEIIERMNIVNRSGHFPQQLSGGQQQRVAVARALVTKLKLVLADEPTGNLDSTHGNEVMELLCELNETGPTIVMVTHSSHDASFSGPIINLKDGHVISEKINKGRTEELI